MDKHRNFIMILDSSDVNQLDELVNKYGVNCEINGATPLYWAVYINNLSAVKRLLELGANPNLTDENRRSCLSVACYFNFVDVSRLLIENQALIDSTCMERAYYGWDGHIQVETLNVLQEYGWINLYLDDLRDIPDGFVGARSVEETISLIGKNKVYILSLDHDLGINEEGELQKTGYDLVKYICGNGIRPANKIYIHTDNIVGQNNMYETLKASQKRGFIDRDIEIYPYSFIKNRYSGNEN